MIVFTQNVFSSVMMFIGVTGEKLSPELPPANVHPEVAATGFSERTATMKLTTQTIKGLRPTDQRQ